MHQAGGLFSRLCRRQLRAELLVRLFTLRVQETWRAADAADAPMLLMLPMLRRGFHIITVGSRGRLHDGYTLEQAELEIFLLKWWSLQAFVDT